MSSDDADLPKRISSTMKSGMIFRSPYSSRSLRDEAEKEEGQTGLADEEEETICLSRLQKIVEYVYGKEREEVARCRGKRRRESEQDI